MSRTVSALSHLPILVLQTMRVGLTVCAAPFLVTWLTDAGARDVVPQGEAMSWLAVVLLMAVSIWSAVFSSTAFRCRTPGSSDRC